MRPLSAAAASADFALGIRHTETEAHNSYLTCNDAASIAEHVPQALGRHNAPRIRIGILAL